MNNNSLQQPKPIMTFKEAMSFLCVSRSTLYRRIWSGDITAYRVGKGKHLRFRFEDLLAMCQPATDMKMTA